MTSTLPTKAGYAVVWRDGDGSAYLGELTLREEGLRLEGSSRSGEHAVRDLRYEDVAAVTVARRLWETDGGRATLVVSARSGADLHVASAVGFGTVQEIAERLAERAFGRYPIAP